MSTMDNTFVEYLLSDIDQFILGENTQINEYIYRGAIRSGYPNDNIQTLVFIYISKCGFTSVSYFRLSTTNTDIICFPARKEYSVNATNFNDIKTYVEIARLMSQPLLPDNMPLFYLPGTKLKCINDIYVSSSDPDDTTRLYKIVPLSSDTYLCRNSKEPKLKFVLMIETLAERFFMDNNNKSATIASLIDRNNKLCKSMQGARNCLEESLELLSE